MREEDASNISGGQADTEDEVTRELRSMGTILEKVSPEQRRQLDMIGTLRPARKKRRK